MYYLFLLEPNYFIWRGYDLHFSLSKPCSFYFACNLTMLSLETSVLLIFFPISVSYFFCSSICPNVVSDVTGHCIKSSLLLLMPSSSCIIASTQSSKVAIPLSPFFLALTTLYVVIIFLNLWTICLSSKPIHFKNGPQWLTRRNDQVCIPLMRFLLQSFVLRSFLVLPKYSLHIFFILAYW